MSLDISLVPPAMIPGVLDQVRDKLETAAKVTSGRVDKDDISTLILDNYYQLWVVFDPEDADIKAIIITELKKYPRAKWLSVQHCVGDRGSLQAIGDRAMGTLERFAQDEMCVGVEFVGRLGWERFADRLGYRKRSIVYQKTI